jgi:hypothetical protein
MATIFRRRTYLPACFHPRKVASEKARKIPREARKNRVSCEFLNHSRTPSQIGKKSRNDLGNLGFGAIRPVFPLPLHKPRVGGSIPPAATSENTIRIAPNASYLLLGLSQIARRLHPVYSSSEFSPRNAQELTSAAEAVGSDETLTHAAASALSSQFPT